jgi:hypothetical protein
VLVEMDEAAAVLRVVMLVRVEMAAAAQPEHLIRPHLQTALAVLARAVLEAVLLEATRKAAAA